VATPFTTPDEEPTEAVAGVLLLHVPPVVILVSVMDEPRHTLPGPEIAAGNGLMVTMADVLQPVPRVYSIAAVPAATPDTIPVAPAAATDGAPLDQVPPGVGLDNVVVPPAHVLIVPVMSAGSALTVTVCVRKHPVPNV
jgi:hypothetical protein